MIEFSASSVRLNSTTNIILKKTDDNIRYIKIYKY